MNFIHWEFFSLHLTSKKRSQARCCPFISFLEQTCSSIPSLNLLACTIDHCALKLGPQREIKEYANMWLFFSCVLKSTEFYHLSSMGISHHLLCSPRILCKQCKLLRLNQCDQFITIVCGYFISDEHRSAMMGLLMPPIYSVIHSLHKSTVTYVTHGKTSSPSIVFTCIRTNCTMPGVMSRYICYEAKGDLCQEVSLCLP